MKSRALAILSIAFLLAGAVGVPAASASNEVRRVTVMTRNLYLGGDIMGLFAATGQQAFLAAVAGLWANVVATDFPVRATRLAAEIDEHEPDLIGLQEVSLWRSGALLNPAPATRVEYDFLATLLGQLRARGEHYRVVAVQENFDGEAPNVVTGRDIRLTDRDVILARTPRHGIRLSNAMNASFPAPTLVAFTHPIIGPLEVTRGWTSVDVSLRGQRFRFINVHLETEDFPAAQMAQAAVLLAGPAATSLPVVIVGDLNSGPGSFLSTYNAVTGAGFTDAWVEANGSGAAPTCCQAADLANETSLLRSRIDLVLFRGATARGFEFDAHHAVRVGEDEADRIAGLWPSDHAGVVATLALDLT